MNASGQPFSFGFPSFNSASLHLGAFALNFHLSVKTKGLLALVEVVQPAMLKPLLQQNEPLPAAPSLRRVAGVTRFGYFSFSGIVGSGGRKGEI